MRFDSASLRLILLRRLRLKMVRPSAGSPLTQLNCPHGVTSLGDVRYALGILAWKRRHPTASGAVIGSENPPRIMGRGRSDDDQPPSEIAQLGFNSARHNRSRARILLERWRLRAGAAGSAARSPTTAAISRSATATNLHPARRRQAPLFTRPAPPERAPKTRSDGATS
jgi:hypothetical protein